MAVGASRLRIIRQLLTESVALALAGGLSGAVVAYWGVDALVAIAPNDIPRIESIALDQTVLTYTLLMSLLTGLFFGLDPALRLSRVNIDDDLRENSRTSVGSSGQHLLRVLVVSEIALALVLLIGGGLMVRSFQAMQRVDRDSIRKPF